MAGRLLYANNYNHFFIVVVVFLFARGSKKMDKKIKCTIKQRQEVARILAARDGVSRITPRHAETVGAMSDKEIIQFLDNNAELVQPLEVEEIRPDDVAGADLFPLCESLVNNYIVSNGWEPEKITPLQWAACCMSVGRWFKARSAFRGVPENENTNKGIKEYNAINGLNIDALTQAAGVWLELCYKFNKAPLLCDFCEFVGINKQTFYNLRDGVTAERIALFKKIEEIQADGLRRRVLNPKESPIGAIFLLKADHGLIEAQKVTHEYIKTGETAESLPDFGNLDGIEDKNG
jgi:hypothetical protein